jgi:phosphatidylethanolamine/phosphatidyl-N-methylethanolamine N-methyltransferase
LDKFHLNNSRFVSNNIFFANYFISVLQWYSSYKINQQGAYTMRDQFMEEDPAWLDYKDRFAGIYDGSNYVSPLQSAVMRGGHRLVEKHFHKSDYFAKVLEIGAGTGEHLSFVGHGFDQYILSDLDIKTLEIAKGKLNERYGNQLLYEQQSGGELGYADNSFDRLIATHVLEHIYRPHLALKEWWRVVKNGGILSILIPTDPGIAWRIGRHFGPRKNALAQGIAYDYVMAREHVNSCNNLIAYLRHYFPERTEAWWPFSAPSIDFNLFFVCHVVVRKT